MGKTRIQAFGRYGICECGNCESVAMRAVEIVGKMLAVDNECPQYQVALGVAISAAASILLQDQIRGVMGDDLVAAIFSQPEAMAVCDDVSMTFKDWMQGPGYDIVTNALNVWIDKANEKHKAEQELPKGT